jgi:diguanylate cyclase (GGDEF)-like protein
LGNWTRQELKSLLLPGGALLLASLILLEARWVSVPKSAAPFAYYAAFAMAGLLSLRFRLSRMAMALMTLLLAERAIHFFAADFGVARGAGRAAYELISVLVPLNFAWISVARERGLVLPQIFAGLALLFAESVLVTLACGTDSAAGLSFLSHAIVSPRLLTWTQIPQAGLLVFTAALAFLLIRARRSSKPLDSGLFWSLAAAWFALQHGALGWIASTYLATAALILGVSIIESSYFMAFHDELTALPGRRAFDQATLGLPDTYAVAVVDIDHFKSFNDTYGHDTGDEVLRMVAAKLAGVSGGGSAYRIGGEEFSILFAGMSAREAAVHLEALRQEIEGSRFRMRAGRDRRTQPRGADRRATKTPRRRSSRAARAGGNSFCVTVSIGVAEPGGNLVDIEDVIRSADQALYRAKNGGRNRVEVAAAVRNAQRKKVIA